MAAPKLTPAAKTIVLDNLAADFQTEYVCKSCGRIATLDGQTLQSQIKGSLKCGGGCDWSSVDTVKTAAGRKAVARFWENILGPIWARSDLANWHRVKDAGELFRQLVNEGGVYVSCRSIRRHLLASGELNVNRTEIRLGKPEEINR